MMKLQVNSKDLGRRGDGECGRASGEIEAEGGRYPVLALGE
ncbi:hypothetical protein [Paenibacillus tyrfis]|nr:hypothetical protein [Paenibacillus tyrfis]